MRLNSALWSAMIAFVFVALPAMGQQAGGAQSPASTAPQSQPPASTGAPAGATAPSTTSTPAASSPQSEEPPKSSGAQAPTPAASDAADSGAVDGSTYAVRLRDLESRVDELKEQIRRSHTRLSLLSDTILSGGVGGARAEIVFKNDMSSAFRLTRALFVLDGAVQYNKQDDTGTLAAQEQIPVFSGSIPPGDHTLQVLIQLRGHGYGVFSYLRGYKFEVKSSHSFTITEGKTIQLETVAFEKGGVTTPLEQRPAVRYVEKIRSGTAADPGAKGGGPVTTKSTSSTSFSVSTGAK